MGSVGLAVGLVGCGPPMVASICCMSWGFRARFWAMLAMGLAAGGCWEEGGDPGA